MKNIAKCIHRAAARSICWIDARPAGSCLKWRRAASLPHTQQAPPLAWMTLLALAGSALLAGGLPIVQEWYVPQPEAQLRADYLVLAPNTNTTCDSVIAITVPLSLIHISEPTRPY